MTTENVTQATENEAQAPGQLEDNEGLLKIITDNLKEARNHWAEWRVNARVCYDFFEGTQWSQEDAKKLEDEERPAVVFNRIARTINAVAGLELQNRQEVRYLPRKVGQVPQQQQQAPGQPPTQQQSSDDSAENEYLSNVSKWVRDGCDAEDEESEAFQDALICGIGGTETRMDYEVDPEGQVMIDRHDPLELLPDPNAKKRNFTDAKWVAHIKEFSRKEMREMWPNFDLQASTFWNDTEGAPHDQTDAHLYKNDQSDKMSKANTFSVAHYQWYDIEKYHQVQDEMGQVHELSEQQFNKLLPLIESRQYQHVKQARRVYKKAFVCGKAFCEPPSELGCNHFTFNLITGLRARNKNTWFGLVSLMLDPQRWANKWLSQIQHIINSGAKNGLIVEQSAISNPGKFEADYAKPGTVSIVNDGALSQGKIQPKEAPRYPDGVDRLLQYAVNAINDVPGVNLEMIGMADRDQPIGLEESRKKAGITILANFFDSLRKYRKTQGRVLAYFIQEYISDGRLARIVGPQGASYVPIIKDKVSFKYDVIVEDSPTSSNSKERTFAILAQIIPMAIQSGIPVPPEVLDYAPLPDLLIQSWKKMIQTSQNDPIKQQLDQIKMMLSQLEVKKTEAETQKISSEATKNYAQAEQFHAVGQDESAQAMQKMGMLQHSHEHSQDMGYEAMMREQNRKDIELSITQQRKENEMLLDQQRRQKEAEFNAQLKMASQRSAPNHF